MAATHSDELAGQLADSFGDVDDLPDGKLTKVDANYEDEGPLPFTCGNCRHIVWGHTERWDYCQIVEGKISPAGACRFWERKPATTKGSQIARQIEGHPLGDGQVSPVGKTATVEQMVKPKLVGGDG